MVWNNGDLLTPRNMNSKTGFGGSNVINVTDPEFGATGDGTTDDAAAIRSAISKAQGLATDRTGSGIVYFPAGNYRCASTITLPEQGKVRLIGASSGIVNSNTAKINDTTNVTRLSHDGTGGNLLSAKGEENSSGASYFVRNLHIENMLLASGASTDNIISLEAATEDIRVSNVRMIVEDSNLTCNGLRLYASWGGIIENLKIRHGSETSGGGSTATTGQRVGILVENDSSTTGFAQNQNVFINCHAAFMNIGVQVGTMSGGDAQHLNSMVFLGGAIQNCNMGLWLGKGVESISFRGVHTERTTDQAIWVGDGAINVKVEDYKSHQDGWNTSNGSGVIMIGDGGARNVTIDNAYFSESSGIAIEVLTPSQDSTDNIRLTNLTFNPKANNRDTGIKLDATLNHPATWIENIVWDYKGTSFLTNIENPAFAMAPRPTRWATRDIARNAAFGVNRRDRGTVFSNQSGSGLVTGSQYTLPNDLLNDYPISSHEYTFVKTSAHTVTVFASSGDTIDSNATAIQTPYNANDNYQTVVLRAIDENNWIVMSTRGSWTTF